jgi:hypothetical protein
MIRPPYWQLCLVISIVGKLIIANHFRDCLRKINSSILVSIFAHFVHAQ